MTALSDLTPWFRQELFCELVTNLFGPPGPFDPPARLDPGQPLIELSESLCSDVRAGDMDVDSAFNRWGREVKRFNNGIGGASGIATFFLKIIAWATSGFLQLIVAVVVFLGTVVGIVVGLKKLLE